MKKMLLIIFSACMITANSQTKIESSITQYYNGGSWENSHGFNYQYDANKNVIVETYLSWNGTNWVNNYKSSYTYNASNKVTEHVEQMWNLSNQFENSTKTIYSYNTDGTLSQILDQDWDGGQWTNAYQTNISYSNMKPSTAVSYLWKSGQWENEYKSTISYTLNKPSQILGEDWKGSQWVLGDRDLYTINGNNKITEDLYEVWNGSIWTEEYRSNYVLDATGNRTSETSKYQGALYNKTEYNYDLSSQLSSFSHPFNDKTGTDFLFEDFPYVNKILSSLNYYYDNATSTYTLSSKTTYNYNSAIVLSTENFEPSPKIQLLPNPASEYITISGLTDQENVSVYTILGSKVLEEVINANNKININNLSKGLYFVKLKNGKTLKFLKN